MSRRRYHEGFAGIEHLPSIELSDWVNLGLCWTWWPADGAHGTAPCLCLIPRAFPHVCCCLHDY